MIRIVHIDSVPKDEYNIPNSYNKNITLYNPNEYTKYLQKFNEKNSLEVLKFLKNYINKQDSYYLINDGEIKRENSVLYHLRYFNGVDFNTLEKDNSRLLPIINNKMTIKKNYIVNDYNLIRLFTQKNNIKVSIAGPTILKKHMINKYYKETNDLDNDIIELINKQLKLVEKDGCRYVQIDENIFIGNDSYNKKIDKVKKCFHKLSPYTYKILNICKDPIFNYKFKGKITDEYKTIFKLINNTNIDAICINYEDIENDLLILDELKNKDVVFGILSTKSESIETINYIKNVIIQISKHINVKKIIVSPNNMGGKLSNNIFYEKIENLKTVVNQLNNAMNYNPTSIISI